MKRWEKWGLHLLTTGVSVTGLVYYWMKYFLQTNDPFAVVNHPWQAGMLEVHLILSPFLVFLTGMVFRSHISGKLRDSQRDGRRSGLLALFSFPIMVISGYLLQVSSDPAFITLLSLLHLVSGSLFLTIFLIHLVVSWTRTANKNRASRRSYRRARTLA